MCQNVKIYQIGQTMVHKIEVLYTKIGLKIFVLGKVTLTYDEDQVVMRNLTMIPSRFR